MSIYEVCEATRIVIEYDDMRVEVGREREPGRDKMKIDGVEYILLSMSFPPYRETWGIKVLEELRLRDYIDE